MASPPPSVLAIMLTLRSDISFPVLPRWFTAPLRARTKRATSVHYPQNALRPPPTPTRPQTPPSRNLPPHDHALLEALFNSVFENRFINMRPSGEQFILIAEERELIRNF